MPSTFTWLDYSEHDRRKMVDVISAFREQDTRDELGIGSIRDGFADILFPGTSTIQTRAGYFLFIPWIYRTIERKKVPSNKVAQFARDREISLINALAKSDDQRGIIGIEARGKLKRLPSNIYWQGMRTWGIRQFPGSQDQYHRSLDHHYMTKGQMLRSDDRDLVSGFSSPNWHAGLPSRPKDFPWSATFALRPEDSEFIKSRILQGHRTSASLLAHLIRQNEFPSDTTFVWESEHYGGFPSEIKRCVDHARCFSEAIHGAALLYNLMLAEKAGRDELVAEYGRDIEDWMVLVATRGGTFAAWDHSDFWMALDRADARVKKGAHDFVTAWLGRALSVRDVDSLMNDRTLRMLIQNRERTLKRGQARLSNPRALELWSGAAGTGRLDFRWAVSKGILTDIMEGFNNA